MAPRLSCSRIAPNSMVEHRDVIALYVSIYNLPGTELVVHVEAGLTVWGDVVERPMTMCEELTPSIIHL